MNDRCCGDKVKFSRYRWKSDGLHYIGTSTRTIRSVESNGVYVLCGGERRWVHNDHIVEINGCRFWEAKEGDQCTR